MICSLIIIGFFLKVFLQLPSCTPDCYYHIVLSYMLLSIIVNKGGPQLELYVSFLCLSFELTLPQSHREIQNATLLRVGHLGGHLILIPQMCSTNSLDTSVLSTTFTMPSNFRCNMSHLRASCVTHSNNNAHIIGHFFIVKYGIARSEM